MRKAIDIAGRHIGRGESAFIIGEIGVNHNGDPAIARELIDTATEVGLDAVKFQSFKAERLVTRGTSKTGYQLETTGGREDQFEMLTSLELSLEDMGQLAAYTRDRGLVFLTTPYDPESLRELGKIGVEALKISSADLLDALLLREAAATGLPLIISTGMSLMDDIRCSLELLRREGAEDIAMLHCMSMYPAPEDAQNLRFMARLEEEFGCPVGYSDHTAGLEAAPLAVAAGACMIEKHFTRDRGMEGPDHRASLDPEGMRELVFKIRRAESILGGDRHSIPDQESANARLMRKSLVFARGLPNGTVLAYEHLAAKRPAGGVPPMDFERYLGKVLSRGVERDERLADEQFEPGEGKG